MANLEITAAQFDAEVLQSPVPVLVDFTATWCGPCKMIAPFVEQIAAEYAGKAKVFKVDVDKEPDLAQRYNVMSIPALHVFKDGKEVTKHTGALPKDKIAGLLDSAI